MNFCYNLLRQVAGIYLAVFVRTMYVTGGDNLLPGPKIIVANHSYGTDCLILPFIVPKEQLRFLIQANLFDVPVLGRLLSGADQIPVVRGHGDEALKAALDKLSAGKVIVIYPEGKLNHGKKLHRGRSGAAVLAMKSGAPIVPVGFYVPPENTCTISAQKQTHKAMSVWQVRGKSYVHIGKPWRVPKTGDARLDPKELHSLTEKIMSQIAVQVQNAKAQAQQTKALTSGPGLQDDNKALWDVPW